MAHIKEYFKTLNTSVFPTKASEYIQENILTDEDIDLLDENDEDFIEVKKLIEESFPTALKASEPTKEVEPTKPSKEVLASRLKLLKKMLEKNPSTTIKTRIKIIEKMLQNHVEM